MVENESTDRQVGIESNDLAIQSAREVAIGGSNAHIQSQDDSASSDASSANGILLPMESEPNMTLISTITQHSQDVKTTEAMLACGHSYVNTVARDNAQVIQGNYQHTTITVTTRSEYSSSCMALAANLIGGAAGGFAFNAATNFYPESSTSTNKSEDQNHGRSLVVDVPGPRKTDVPDLVRGAAYEVESPSMTFEQFITLTSPTMPLPGLSAQPLDWSAWNWIPPVSDQKQEHVVEAVTEDDDADDTKSSLQGLDPSHLISETSHDNEEEKDQSELTVGARDLASRERSPHSSTEKRGDIKHCEALASRSIGLKYTDKGHIPQTKRVPDIGRARDAKARASSSTATDHDKSTDPEQITACDASAGVLSCSPDTPCSHELLHDPRANASRDVNRTSSGDKGLAKSVTIGQIFVNSFQEDRLGQHQDCKMSASSELRHKYKHCYHCRLGKRKCDRQKPECFSCKLNGYQCSYDLALPRRSPLPKYDVDSGHELVEDIHRVDPCRTLTMEDLKTPTRPAWEPIPVDRPSVSHRAFNFLHDKTLPNEVGARSIKRSRSSLAGFRDYVSGNSWDYSTCCIPKTAGVAADQERMSKLELDTEPADKEAVSATPDLDVVSPPRGEVSRSYSPSCSPSDPSWSPKPLISRTPQGHLLSINLKDLSCRSVPKQAIRNLQDGVPSSQSTTHQAWPKSDREGLTADINNAGSGPPMRKAQNEANKRPWDMTRSLKPDDFMTPVGSSWQPVLDDRDSFIPGGAAGTGTALERQPFMSNDAGHTYDNTMLTESPSVSTGYGMNDSSEEREKKRRRY